MKSIIPMLMMVLTAAFAHGEFRTWTRSDGKTAQLELFSVSDKDGEKAGEFKTRKGDKAVIKSSALSAADAKLMAEWKPTEGSVFDQSLNGNLLKLKDGRLQPFLGLKRPTTYYVFYYTASWCGPCQAYTPFLVSFYNQYKNDSFEIVLITSDDSTRDMEAYAKAKQMPWPILKLQSAKAFKKTFAHGVAGIPSLITCGLDGEIVSREVSFPELAKILK
jgi:thiol-disulfide isomerase/thioredoxin